MVFFDRIQKIIDYYGIKNVNSFAKDYLKYDSSEKINRLKGKNALPSYTILHDISIKFEKINPDWLLTGRGEMLQTQGDDRPAADQDCQKCKEKERVIQSQQKTIDTQADLIECLQSMRKDCKTPEKKNQSGTDFPSLPTRV